MRHAALSTHPTRTLRHIPRSTAHAPQAHACTRCGRLARPMPTPHSRRKHTRTHAPVPCTDRSWRTHTRTNAHTRMWPAQTSPGTHARRSPPCRSRLIPNILGSTLASAWSWMSPLSSAWSWRCSRSKSRSFSPKSEASMARVRTWTKLGLDDG